MDERNEVRRAIQMAREGMMVMVADGRRAGGRLLFVRRDGLQAVHPRSLYLKGFELIKARAAEWEMLIVTGYPVGKD